MSWMASRILVALVRSCYSRAGTRIAALAAFPYDSYLAESRTLAIEYMLLVGLTGNIGSGKSTVAQLLSERGATIIDADVLARRAVEVGTAAHKAIVERWGTSILEPSGMLDRAALRRIVFSEPSELEQLNALVHPEVERMRAALVEQARLRGDKLVVCDIPLLFERRMTDVFDKIVLVDAPRPVRLERLVRERGLRETEAMAMIVAQMPAELKGARADFVIDNAGTLAQLDARVAEVWGALEQAAELVGSGAFNG
jgi:dephospho-CoA kinase